MSWRPRGDERQRLTGCTWCDDDVDNDGDYDDDNDHDNDGDDDGNDVNEQEMQEKC